ncbi:MAG TPA: HNH endonuclease [Gemmatimonadaceae bacterium]|jgi:putative restriction endonuclease|nr:HNH endonuclease [Gemmatimonadaceae bacterium]
MPSSIDDEVRAAAIAKVRQLRDLYGGRIPRAVLMEGISLRGERVPIWNYQKGIFKPAAFGPNGAALSIQTSVASPYADVHDSEAGHIVYKYRGTDPGHPDNVALRIAQQEQRPLIYLVAVDPGFYDAIVPMYVATDAPATLEFTLVADQIGAADYAADPVKTAVRREYATRAVLQRLHQQEFRRMVLVAYREQCCICRLRHVELLDAAHILPDRHPKGEPIVTNGLGLCKMHHSAYDANIIGIDPDSQVHVREDILEEKDGPMLRHGLQEVAGSKLILPRKNDLKPNRDFLAERFDRFRAA